MASFSEAKAHKEMLEANVKATSDALRSFPGEGPMGLVPDGVRATREWQAAKHAYDAAFKRLRNFNEHYVKEYVKEIRAERRARGR